MLFSVSGVAASPRSTIIRSPISRVVIGPRAVRRISSTMRVISPPLLQSAGSERLGLDSLNGHIRRDNAQSGVDMPKFCTSLASASWPHSISPASSALRNEADYHAVCDTAVLAITGDYVRTAVGAFAT
jgi:hypothetical protein